MRGGADDLAEELRREAEFHDELAAAIDPAAPIDPPDQWERSILNAIGPLEGKRVLDYGCGDGKLSYHLLERGASNITGFDISGGMVEVARQRCEAAFPHATTRFLVADAHDTGLESAAFDVVVGKWVLHHLDLDLALEELARILAPGGRAVFIETSRLNPVVPLARRAVHSRRLGGAVYGTPDERPLGRRELRQIRQRFARARIDFPVFSLLFLVDRNLLRFRSPRWTKRLWKADRAIERWVPGIRRMSYYVRIVLET